MFKSLVVQYQSLSMNEKSKLKSYDDFFLSLDTNDFIL